MNLSLRTSAGWRRCLPLALLALFVLPAYAQDYSGTWSVSLGATGATNHDYRQVDDMTVQRTSTTTLSSGASDLGTLEIYPNGTYRLRFWEYDKVYGAPLIEGAWRVVAPSEMYFHQRQGIELLNAKPTPSADAVDRKWYIFRTEKGDVEARYPPYDGYARIVLKRAGAVAVRPPVVHPPQAASTPAGTRPANVGGQTEKRVYTPDQVRAVLTGKTLAEVQALLGSPVKEAYGTFSWNGVEQHFPPAPGGNWKSFAIQFQGPGQTASSIELQYWLVE